jgi:polar amino acid transport system permease protein
MPYQWRFDVVWQALPFMLQGLGMTVLLTVISMAISLALGLLVSLARLSKSRLATVPAWAYTEFFRGTPFLVQLLWVYYSLPILTGLRFSSFVSGLIALSINLGAFIAEIFRAGITSIEKGQREAALALGMTWWQMMVRIILPQAVRRVIPPLGSMWVSLFKDTSLVSVIAVSELMYQAKLVSIDTYRPMEVYTVLAAIYFLVTYPQARFVDRLFQRHRVRA